MKAFGTICAAAAGFTALLVLIVGLTFGSTWLKIQWMRFFGTEIESARTDIYRENKSYVEGTVRDLREMRVEYLKASDEHKDALASLILQRANELDWDRLPSDVRGFLKEISE